MIVGLTGWIASAFIGDRAKIQVWTIRGR